MRLVIQRVLEGSVLVEGSPVGSIGPGLLVLVGLTHDDGPDQFQAVARKLVRMRLWHSEERTWDLSVVQKGYELLLVSQFTLHAVLKGNKPDFHQAMRSDQALELFNQFVEQVGREYDPSKVQTGAFGQYMNVHLVNDGPVTIHYDSKKN